MASEEDDLEPWWIYLVYLSTLLPWGVIQVYDSIDHKPRHVKEMAFRLSISLFLVAVSTCTGLFYVVWADQHSRTESATMCLGVALNSWHWLRNARGWLVYRVLQRQSTRIAELVARFMCLRNRGMNPTSSADMPAFDPELAICNRGPRTHMSAAYWASQWDDMWVNDTVIDNDPRQEPITNMLSQWETANAGEVMWRMFWLQGTMGRSVRDSEEGIVSERRRARSYDTTHPPSEGERNLIREEELDDLLRRRLNVGPERSVPWLREQLDEMSREDQTSLQNQATERSAEKQSRWRPPQATERWRSLESYDVGQQDVWGIPPVGVDPVNSLPALWSAMSWITEHAPRPMEHIWYETSALVTNINAKSTPRTPAEDRPEQWPAFPGYSTWLQIASDVARQRKHPLYLSTHESKRYALRIAATSKLLAYHYYEYTELCSHVYKLGKIARWTHGWSGRVACYSKYWTMGNVAMSLIGGLPLLIISLGCGGKDEVKCLLVGLASENIMSMYLSDSRRAARTEELERRYRKNKGKTCRGSGVMCIRQALKVLNLPQSASQLDGVVAFAVGWAKEAVDGLPGNQKPRHGNDHAEVEEEYGSCRAYRFPDDRLK